MGVWDVEGPTGFLTQIKFKQLLGWEGYSQIEPLGGMEPIKGGRKPREEKLSPRGVMDKLKGLYSR